MDRSMDSIQILSIELKSVWKAVFVGLALPVTYDPKHASIVSRSLTNAALTYQNARKHKNVIGM
jgi:hypothetical protein